MPKPNEQHDNYWQAVTDVAEQIVAEVRDADPDEDRDELLHRLLHENTDDHDYVVRDDLQIQTLQYSQAPLRRPVQRHAAGRTPSARRQLPLRQLRRRGVRDGRGGQGEETAGAKLTPSSQITLTTSRPVRAFSGAGAVGFALLLDTRQRTASEPVAPLDQPSFRDRCGPGLFHP